VGCVGVVVDGGTVLTLVPVGLVLEGLALSDAVAGAVVLVTAEELWTLSPVSFGVLPEVSTRAMTATMPQAARAAPTAMSHFLLEGELEAGSDSESG
jgi:hypothetical protein